MSHHTHGLPSEIAAVACKRHADELAASWLARWRNLIEMLEVRTLEEVTT
jgi:hypothetical protein